MFLPVVVVGLPSVPLVSDAKNFGEGFPHGESYPSETRYAWKSQYLNPGGQQLPWCPGVAGEMVGTAPEK